MTGWPAITDSLDDQDRKPTFSEKIPETATAYQLELHGYIESGKAISGMGFQLSGRRYGQIYLPDRMGAKSLKELTGTLRFQADSVVGQQRKTHEAELPFQFKNVVLR